MNYPKEKLYETLGELLFVIAMADGEVQETELAALKNLLAKHPWAQEIEWSFNYELSRNSSVEDTYKKVIDFCTHNGPTPEYEEFISAMEMIAESSDGIDENESKVIKGFSKDLIDRFKKDIHRIN